MSSHDLSATLRSFIVICAFLFFACNFYDAIASKEIYQKYKLEVKYYAYMEIYLNVLFLKSSKEEFRMSDPLSQTFSQLNGYQNKPIRAHTTFNVFVWIQNGLFLVFSIFLCTFQIKLSDMSVDYLMINENVTSTI